MNKCINRSSNRIKTTSQGTPGISEMKYGVDYKFHLSFKAGLLVDWSWRSCTTTSAAPFDRAADQLSDCHPRPTARMKTIDQFRPLQRELRHLGAAVGGKWEVGSGRWVAVAGESLLHGIVLFHPYLRNAMQRLIFRSPRSHSYIYLDYLQ